MGTNLKACCCALGGNKLNAIFSKWLATLAGLVKKTLKLKKRKERKENNNLFFKIKPN